MVGSVDVLADDSSINIPVDLLPDDFDVSAKDPVPPVVADIIGKV